MTSLLLRSSSLPLHLRSSVRSFAMPGGKKAAPAKALTSSKMKSNKEKKGAGEVRKDDKTATFVKMIDSQERGKISQVDMDYLQDPSIAQLVTDWSNLKNKMHNTHYHNMQCKIDLKWNAREALVGSEFVDMADVIDKAWTPVARK